MTRVPISGGGRALPPVTAAALRAPTLPVGPGPVPCGPRAVAPVHPRAPGTARATGTPAVRQHGPAQPPRRRGSGGPAGGSARRPGPAAVAARAALPPLAQPSDRSTPCS